MDRKELFFSLLGSELEKEGFEYKKSINGFSKKEGGNEFLYEIDASQGFLKIEPNFRIIIKSVEDIKKKAWAKLYDKFESVGQTKRYLLPKEIMEQCYSWTDTDEAVRKAVQKEVDYYYSFLKNYYKSYSDILFIDKYLNTEPYEHRILAHTQVHTYFLAIIVAKLAKNANIVDLISYYKPLVGKHNKDYMEEYELLSKYLLEV